MQLTAINKKNWTNLDKINIWLVCCDSFELFCRCATDPPVSSADVQTQRCVGDFRMAAGIILKPGPAHDLITVYSMDWLLKGNGIQSVRSQYLVSVLQHTADSHKFPARQDGLSEVAVKLCSSCWSISFPAIWNWKDTLLISPISVYWTCHQSGQKYLII